MNERQEELACLYALGSLSREEAEAFEKELLASSELQQMVTGLHNTTSAIAGSAPRLRPPSGLKQQILESITNQPQASKIVSYQGTVAQKPPSVSWLPWAIAACLAALSVVQIQQNKALQSQMAENGKSLQARVDSLSTQVAELQKKDSFSQMRIAMLSSVIENSKAAAVSVWDNEHQKGVIMVENLPVLPPDKDYQLWIIHSKYPAPVNGGVFTVDENGRVRFYFKADMPMPGVDKFAVSIERKGGVPKAEGKMVLVGG